MLNKKIPTKSGQTMAGQVGVGGQIVPPLERQRRHGRGRHRTSLTRAGTVRVHVGRAEMARAVDRLHAGVARGTCGGFGGRRQQGRLGEVVTAQLGLGPLVLDSALEDLEYINI